MLGIEMNFLFNYLGAGGVLPAQGWVLRKLVICQGGRQNTQLDSVMNAVTGINILPKILLQRIA